ncbi:Rv3235 family protein [Cryobacterium sp. SO2]|uniref:Rv3235 family protein n=1 Tax=Cryobacterium sp. SO2 TaxID=1897060 RepID=UPI00223E48B2|nr:Rv3235 family protein [Cryobacterium sp. SO2]WEO78182.1 Rv3235 family protein [Cryobacterium sp. SO2]
MSDPLAEPDRRRPQEANPPNLPEPSAGAASGHPERESAEGFIADDFFGHQPSSRSTLPDPEPLLINLTRCVIEVLAGARELDQLARWVSDDVYRHLLKRVVLSARARAVKGQRAQRPAITIGRVTINEPRDGIIEAVVIVHSKVRVRAVAVRLEGLDNRWRASAINVL